MSEYKKVKIGDFLTEREGRYKPNDNILDDLKRLEKIDFSGNIHISDKPSKTDMIIVQPGDLVISGINVAKGAITVYRGDEPVKATIHYSSYIFDDSKVDLDYFKFFVKSPAFIDTLQKQVKGGIKTEIKPKSFLPLEISIPDLETQKEIVKIISKNLQRVNELTAEIESQKSYTKQLHQNILQDAIEGKLTAEWRKTHPLVKGNPDFDAEALFEQIQKEKKNDKKQKALAPIGDDEKPFEIPDGWKWVRLGKVCKKLTDGSHNPPPDTGIGYPVISAMNIKNGQISFSSIARYTDEEGFIKENKRTQISRGDIIMGIIGASIGNVAIYNHDEKVIAQRSISIIDTFVDNKFIEILLNSKFIQNLLVEKAFGSAQGGVYLGKISNLLVPLSSQYEQKEIIEIVNKLLLQVENLEQQISQREEYANQLMQSILKDAFEER